MQGGRGIPQPMLPAFLVSLLAVAAPLSSLHTTVQGSIEASLSGMTAHQASALGAQIARLLRWRGDVVRNVHPGDDLRIVYELAEAPELVALVFDGAEIDLAAYRFADADGVERFWDEDGRLIEPVLSNAPVASYVQITETVQRGRGKRQHAGIDFKADVGTSVRLPFAGTVTRRNWSRRVNGNCVEVALADGRRLLFLHLDRVDPTVRPGASLAANALIGAVGNTGISNAPHLHYEIRAPDGSPLDPLRIHGTSTAALAPARLPAFAAHRDTLERFLADSTTAATRGG